MMNNLQRALADCKLKEMNALNWQPKLAMLCTAAQAAASRKTGPRYLKIQSFRASYFRGDLTAASLKASSLSMLSSEMRISAVISPRPH
jgi:hypothetical protein